MEIKRSDVIIRMVANRIAEETGTKKGTSKNFIKRAVRKGYDNKTLTTYNELAKEISNNLRKGDVPIGADNIQLILEGISPFKMEMGRERLSTGIDLKTFLYELSKREETARIYVSDRKWQRYMLMDQGIIIEDNVGKEVLYKEIESDYWRVRNGRKEWFVDVKRVNKVS